MIDKFDAAKFIIITKLFHCVVCPFLLKVTEVNCCEVSVSHLVAHSLALQGIVPLCCSMPHVPVESYIVLLLWYAFVQIAGIGSILLSVVC